MQDTPELQAMEDTNEGGTPNMSRQRQIERDLLLSKALREAIEKNDIQLVTYRQIRRDN